MSKSMRCMLLAVACAVGVAYLSLPAAAAGPPFYSGSGAHVLAQTIVDTPAIDHLLFTAPAPVAYHRLEAQTDTANPAAAIARWGKSLSKMTIAGLRNRMPREHEWIRAHYMLC